MDIGTTLKVDSLLAAAGYRVEGPGGAADGELAGCYWWTLTRGGWIGIECGPHFHSAAEARADARRALLADEDLDWRLCTVRDHAVGQFPPDFTLRMADAR
jgi:hypothetical protein